MHQKEQRDRVSFTNKSSSLRDIVDNLEQFSYFVAFNLYFIGDGMQPQPKMVQKKISSRPFRCDVCKRITCSTEAKLNEHKLNFHSFRCQVCDRSFPMAADRDAHETGQHNLRKNESILSSIGVDSPAHATNTYNLRKRSI